MDDDNKQRPESLLPYERWIEQALRHVVAQAIDHAARQGLPGGHHFYLTFRTTDPGVEIPTRVLAQYPKEITVVLQNQFWDLSFDKASQTIRVGLSFGGVPAKLAIPLDSVVEFADPHIRYGLRFQPRDDDAPSGGAVVQALVPAVVTDSAPVDTGAGGSGPASADPASAEPAPAPAEPAQVVSLDAFRRRSSQE